MSHSSQPESGSPTSSMPPYVPGSPAQPRSNKTLMIVLIVVAMVLVGLAAYFFGANSGRSSSSAATEQTTQADPAEGQNQGQGEESGEETDGSGGTGDPAQGDAESEEASEERAPLAPVAPELAQVIDDLHRLDPDDPYALGDVDATIVIEMYSDYRCGYCIEFSTTVLPELQEHFDNGTARLEYNSLPVLGDQSVLAAQASHAAAEQDMFWEYHEALMDGHQDFTEDGLVALANEVGIPDAEQFRTTMTAADTVAEVNASRDQALGMGITGTPAFIVGYSYVPGFVDVDTFNQVIEQELTRPEHSN